MSILKALGIGGSSKSWPGGGAEAAPNGDTDTVRRIVAEIEALPVEKARYLAAFAYILSRVANADYDISADETRKMEEIVRRLGHLPADQALLVVQIAKSQNRLFGGTENFLVTREFKEISTPEQRAELLDCLFEVSAADASITGDEERQIRQIATELGFSHREYVETRRDWSEHRSIFQTPSAD